MPTPAPPLPNGYWAAFDDITFWLDEHAPETAAKFADEWRVPEWRTRQDPRIDNGITLTPAESIALTAALTRTQRGETLPPNTATVCVLALARITGRHDWTEDVG